VDKPMDKSINNPPSVSEVAGHAATEVVDAVHDNFAAAIRRNPLQSVAIAVGVGFIAALLVRH
jgi:ElaB/YqjD/DUF883 family membrane-anchored ribosome-binding protein